MKIINFRYEDKALEWRLENLSLDKITLLVGASGAGKTQILKALMNLKKIAEGKSLSGVAWYLEFETLDKNHYIWEGEFEIQETLFLEEIDFEESNLPKIVFEKLYLNAVSIVNRNNYQIIFKGQITIKLSQNESVLHLLKEESMVKIANESLRKLHFSNQLGFAETMGTEQFSYNKKNLNKYNSLSKIQQSDFRTSIKLFLLSSLKEDHTFELIKNRLISIFPTIEDFQVKLEKQGFFGTNHIIKIQIKEKGVNQWIELQRMSWGMVRTLKQLSELYLCAEGTVFLIDEFENSLGINCINEITQDILASKRQLQFVLTSHHPYIIDAIPFDHWKLVTRNASVIKTHNIDKFNIGKSRHSAFMQLIQLEEYQTGQEQL